jgi:hypothetical protein
VDVAPDLSRISLAPDDLSAYADRPAPSEARGTQPLARARTLGPLITDTVVREIVEGLLRLVDDSPGLAARLREVFGGGQNSERQRLLVTKSEYAQHVNYSVRKLDQLIKAGMPTVGAGRALRVSVDEADRWVLTHLKVRQDADYDVVVAALTSARKRAGRHR